jgi:hypothetical protein
MNILKNIPSYLDHMASQSWRGLLKNIPAAIIGAGPSLAVSIESLCKYSDKIIIFCSDSSLRALAKRGIKADFAISIDVAKVPDKCLPLKEFEPRRTVVALTSPPQWTDSISKETIYRF